MAARKPEPSDPSQLVPFTFRIPSGLVTALDAWLDEQNAARGGAPLTRSDLIRGVLSWATENKPMWDQGRFVLELQDPTTGEPIARVRTRHGAGAEVLFTVDGEERVSTFVATRVEGDDVVMVYRARGNVAAHGPKAPPGYL